MSCQYYDRGNSSAGEVNGPMWGQCRRSSPMLHPVNVKSYMIEGVWPHVRDDDWCGQWLAPGQSHAAAVPARATGAAAAVVAAAPAPRPAAPPRPSMLTPLPANGNGAATHGPNGGFVGMHPRGNSD